MSTARDFALVQLDAKRLPDSPAHRIPRRLATQVIPPTDPRDRALAEQVETGVVKNLLLLQHLMVQYASRPLSKIHPLLQKILAIAIYQLRFLDRIPASAAVDEAVEQAKRFGMKHAAGFVNAVLRKATAEKSTPLPESADPQTIAELRWSHPPELFTGLSALFGIEQALAICQHDNSEPPLIIRLCHGRTADDLARLSITALPHETPGMFILPDANRATLATLAREGIAQVQDPTSAGVIPAATISPATSLLDRCCGMGTKTLQAWELAGPESAIVAIDPAQARCDALREMLIARHITNIRVLQASDFPTGLPDIPQTYHRVLVDAPCSNSGVLARRPEARYAQTDQALNQLRDLQRRILKDSLKRVAPGGQLIYSTCSIWPEENEQMADWLLNQNPGFQLTHQQTTLPSCTTDPTRYHDGGYYALLTRKR